MSIIKDRLKLLMKLLGINLKEFAEISGIPYRTLQNYTLGVREPTIENLQKMANATNCDLHWLITGKGKPFREEPKEHTRGCRAWWWFFQCGIRSKSYKRTSWKSTGP